MLRMQKELDKIRKRFLNISVTVEETLQKMIRCVIEMDRELAQEIIMDEDKIDKMEVEMEEECLKLLALYQPVAADLRFIIALLKINNDMERIGDLSEHIARRVFFLHDKKDIDFPFDFKKMSSIMLSMLKKSIDALITLDIEKAYEVLEEDDKIDAIHKQMFYTVEETIKTSPEKIGMMINLVGISRYVERIADHIANISEDIIYMIDGEIIRHNRN